MLRRFRKNRGQEYGNAAFITVFLMLPVLAAFFGLAVDGAKGRYAQQQAQNNVQSAAVAGASQLDTNAAKINFAGAKATAIDSYTKNRANYGKNMRCAKAGDVKAGESLQGGSCPWILTGFTVAPDGKSLSMSVREYTPNAWLGQVGLDDFIISVGSTARLSSN